MRGSSPLARGTPNPVENLLAVEGLIPARAGNTSTGKIAAYPTGAHPRSRGEHPGALQLFNALLGSSPLARGTLQDGGKLACCQGLIPARAGNTDSLTETQERAWAHPRSRGEHHSKRSLSRTSMGSSPLARGTRTQGDARAAPAGLIPARAGNTIRI